MRSIRRFRVMPGPMFSRVWQVEERVLTEMPRYGCAVPSPWFWHSTHTTFEQAHQQVQLLEERDMLLAERGALASRLDATLDAPGAGVAVHAGGEHLPRIAAINARLAAIGRQIVTKP